MPDPTSTSTCPFLLRLWRRSCPHHFYSHFFAQLKNLVKQKGRMAISKTGLREFQVPLIRQWEKLQWSRKEKHTVVKEEEAEISISTGKPNTFSSTTLYPLWFSKLLLLRIFFWNRISDSHEPFNWRTIWFSVLWAQFSRLCPWSFVTEGRALQGGRVHFLNAE